MILSFDGICESLYMQGPQENTGRDRPINKEGLVRLAHNEYLT